MSKAKGKRKHHMPPTEKQDPTSASSPESMASPQNNEVKVGSFGKTPWTMIIVIVLVVVGAIYFLVKQNDDTSHNTSQQTVTAQAQVSITSGGFSPANINVKSGSQVIWTNDDSEPHQVAADPYPKNNSIDGFNSTVVLQKGDTYSFIFSKAGTYHLHDQLNPLKVLGTVIVE